MKIVDLATIDPNPYQPISRTEVSEQEAEALARSIQEVGLIHIPVVREIKGGRYQMADGWRRLQAYRYLFRVSQDKKYAQFPVEIRELDDRQMADTVIHSAYFRKNLDPIQQAEIFAKYIKDFKVTQEVLAARNNMSQGEVGNTLRLLQLPAEVKKLVADGSLPQTHARHFLRLEKLPRERDKLVKDFLAHGMSVNQLDGSVHSAIWKSSRSCNPKARNWENPPLFDINPCKGCENGTMAHEPYGSEKSELRCLDISCWEKKQAAAVAAQEKALQDKLKVETKENKGARIFTSKDLDYDHHQELDYRTPEIADPGECLKCDKAVLFKYDTKDTKDTDKPKKVCSDPTCYRKKKAKKTKDDNKVALDGDRALTAALIPALQRSAKRPKEALLVIARHVVNKHLDAAAKTDLLQVMPDLPTASGKLDIDGVAARMEAMTLEQLLELTVATIFCGARRNDSRYQPNKHSAKLSPELELDLATLEGHLDKHLKGITAFQEANCRHCSHATLVLIGTGRDACSEHWRKHLLEDGNCQVAQDEIKRAARSPEQKTKDAAKTAERDKESQRQVEEDARAAGEADAQAEGFTDETAAPKSEKMAGGTVPCDSCANDNVSCHRERFHVDTNSDAYVCEFQKPISSQAKKSPALPTVADISQARKQLNKEKKGAKHATVH